MAGTLMAKVMRADGRADRWINWRTFAQLDFRIDGIVYRGASAIDASSEADMLRALLEPMRAMEDGPAKEQLRAQLTDFDGLLRAYSTPPPEPEPGASEGSYKVRLVGNCIEPLAKHGNELELHPTRPVRPGDLAAMVYRYAFIPHAAVYLGTIKARQRVSVHAGLPRSKHFLFFQPRPAQAIAIADSDLVALHRIEAIQSQNVRRPIKPWPFDVRDHPDLANIMLSVKQEPVSRGEKPLPLHIHDELRAYLETLAGAIDKNGGEPPSP